MNIRIPPSARRQPPPPGRSSAPAIQTCLVKEEIQLHRTRPYYSRRCKRVSSTNIESLPDELLFHILVRLQADYLYDIARLVCRRWYHLIHSRAFVNTHIQHSAYGLLLSDREGGGYPIFVNATQGRIQTSEFSYKCRTHLWGSFNGLAMEIHYGDCDRYFIHIINPATKQPFVLPSFPFYNGRILYSSTCGVASAADSVEYKVALSYIAHVPPDSPSWALAILTVGVDNSWRYVRIEHLSKLARSLLCEIPLITEGFMHWAEITSTDVLTLDVETEILTVSEVPLPEANYRNAHKFYLSTGRSLSLLVTRENFLWELWVMKPGTREWTKLVADMKLGAQKCRLQQFSGGVNEVLMPIGWVKYPEVLALCFIGESGSRTCIFYNLDTHEIDSIELKTACYCLECVVHKNSLMWLS
ncbi:hypothetical protein C2S53_015750 [Perilla frutescens var. hirtella]|uniref:F-box domain-containing protein n=1 Tax=Perilla frutescens var. hirtella TaxID=608512 RepID=A0AAD4PAX3_PERFH|nr:hypothetical protein C2S53_015750 [Perilla frutescens var. hirtella]